MTFIFSFLFVCSYALDCGSGIIAGYNEINGSLIISGNGDVQCKIEYNGVKTVEIGEGIVSLPDGFLRDQEFLETVSLPSTLTKIGSF